MCIRVFFCYTSGLIMQTYCNAQSASANKKFPFRHRFSSCLTMHRSAFATQISRCFYLRLWLYNGFVPAWRHVANVADGKPRIVYSSTKSNALDIKKPDLAFSWKMLTISHYALFFYCAMNCEQIQYTWRHNMTMTHLYNTQ